MASTFSTTAGSRLSNTTPTDLSSARLATPFTPLGFIIATGGASWPQTGSIGDGYHLTRSLGHDIVSPKPCLVPLVSRQRWFAELAGVSVPHVRHQAKIAGKEHVVAGPMIFTHHGLGGPAVLQLSRILTDLLPAPQSPIQVLIDLLPNLTHQQLHQRLFQAAKESPKKIVPNLLLGLLPRRLASVLCSSVVSLGQIQAAQLTKQSRNHLVDLLKALPVDIVRTRPLKEAQVTRGGVSTDQVDPATMRSRLCPGLFLPARSLMWMVLVEATTSRSVGPLVSWRAGPPPTLSSHSGRRLLLDAPSWSIHPDRPLAN